MSHSACAFGARGVDNGQQRELGNIKITNLFNEFKASL